jgi:hypothetical protein
MCDLQTQHKQFFQSTSEAGVDYGQDLPLGMGSETVVQELIDS